MGATVLGWNSAAVYDEVEAAGRAVEEDPIASPPRIDEKEASGAAPEAAACFAVVATVGEAKGAAEKATFGPAWAREEKLISDTYALGRGVMVPMKVTSWYNSRIVGLFFFPPFLPATSLSSSVKLLVTTSAVGGSS